MARDIEEFLRQAALKRQQQQQGQAAPPPRQVPARPAQPPPPRQPQQKKRVRRGTAPTQKNLTSQTSETVADRVRRRLDTSDIAEHTRQLGSEVALADDKLEARLHEKFDHELVSLNAYGDARITKKQRDAAAKLTPTNLLDLLKNRDSLRQAIIVAEILQRPNFDD